MLVMFKQQELRMLKLFMLVTTVNKSNTETGIHAMPLLFMASTAV
jgi:hypothetical protein